MRRLRADIPTLFSRRRSQNFTVSVNALLFHFYYIPKTRQDMFRSQPRQSLLWTSGSPAGTLWESLV